MIINKNSPGVIQLIQRKHRLEDILEIESSPIIGETRKASNVFNYKDKDLRFESEAGQSTFFKFSFKNIGLYISSYRIRSSDNGVNYSHPKSWSLYGSNNNSTWELLDRRENLDDLNGYLRNEMFTLDKVIGPFNTFKINETTSWWYVNKLMFSEFDVYDKVIIDAYRFCCKTIHVKRKTVDMFTLVIVCLITC